MTKLTHGKYFSPHGYSPAGEFIVLAPSRQQGGGKYLPAINSI